MDQGLRRLDPAAPLASSRLSCQSKQGYTFTGLLCYYMNRRQKAQIK